MWHALTTALYATWLLELIWFFGLLLIDDFANRMDDAGGNGKWV